MMAMSTIQGCSEDHIGERGLEVEEDPTGKDIEATSVGVVIQEGRALAAEEGTENPKRPIRNPENPQGDTKDPGTVTVALKMNGIKPGVRKKEGVNVLRGETVNGTTRGMTMMIG